LSAFLRTCDAARLPRKGDEHLPPAMMPWVNQLVAPLLVTFVLVLTRVGGLVMSAPIFGTSDIPVRVRAFLAIALAVLITPLQVHQTSTMPTSVIDLGLLMVAELIVGLVLGLGITLLFSGIQIAGQIISQIAGVQLADVINPTFDANVPVFSQILFYVALAVFVITGGHRQVMEALLDTFVSMPPGKVEVSDTLVEAFTNLLTQSFILGVRAAAPTMTALLLATLVLALLSRTLPQLNLMAVGFGLSSLVTFGTLSVSLGIAAWAFQEEVDPSLEILLNAVQAASSESPGRSPGS
jgi:flagellar biosynthesis protein FliR